MQGLVFDRRFGAARAVKGQAIIEAIGSIIIFTLLLGVVMSVTVYLYFQQALVTAARDGARTASFNTDLGDRTTEQQGMDTVREQVAQKIRMLTGQSFDAQSASIVIVPPSASDDQTPGNRNVSVQIRWSMHNPVGVGGLFSALGSDGGGFQNMPVNAAATMRYEE